MSFENTRAEEIFFEIPARESLPLGTAIRKLTLVDEVLRAAFDLDDHARNGNRLDLIPTVVDVRKGSLHLLVAYENLPVLQVALSPLFPFYQSVIKILAGDEFQAFGSVMNLLALAEFVRRMLTGDKGIPSIMRTRPEAAPPRTVNALEWLEARGPLAQPSAEEIATLQRLLTRPAGPKLIDELNSGLVEDLPVMIIGNDRVPLFFPPVATRGARPWLGRQSRDSLSSGTFRRFLVLDTTRRDAELHTDDGKYFNFDEDFGSLVKLDLHRMNGAVIDCDVEVGSLLTLRASEQHKRILHVRGVAYVGGDRFVPVPRGLRAPVDA